MSATLTLTVVDDDERSRSLLVRRLESRGFRVEGAASVAEALHILHRDQPAAMIVDLSLRGRERGEDLARAVKASEAAWLTPMIAVSGYTDFQTRQRADEAGFDEYFEKPVDFDALFVALCTLVGAEDP